MLSPAGILQKRVQVITMLKLKGGNLYRKEILTKPLLHLLVQATVLLAVWRLTPGSVYSKHSRYILLPWLPSISRYIGQQQQVFNRISTTAFHKIHPHVFHLSAQLTKSNDLLAMM